MQLLKTDEFHILSVDQVALLSISPADSRSAGQRIGYILSINVIGWIEYI